MTASELARRRFAAVALPHLDAAYSLAKALAGNGPDAEDIVQEACLRALNALERQEIEQPRAWMLTVTRNAALTFLARRAPPNPADIGDLEREGRLTAPAPGPDAEARLIAADEGEALRGALAALPLPLRETLLMRVTHGLSYRDIAAATQAPVGTVMSRLARARAALAQALGDKR
ncbi:sigma-70 family RNA polymerase sigma factor [Rhodoblastus sp.]|uniref:sigma-70 family RNA polymerase sigma factor n=1 Tax=Rhodoblastus sp. TaxID=1962975 RepID=UPI0035AFCAB4